MMKKENPILGNGRFKVSACKGQNSIRGKFYALAITPHEGEARKVGQKLSKDEMIPFIDDSKDIAIYFTNVEAVDVVINNLNKVKKFIEEEHSNGRKNGIKPDLVIIDDMEKDKPEELIMPNYCPYCGSRELYDPNPNTSLGGPYCDDCGCSIDKVKKSKDIKYGG